MSEPEPTTSEPPEPTPPTTPEPVKNWQESFSTDMRSNPSFSKFADASKDAAEFGSRVFEGYTQIQKTLGTNRITKPDENSPQEVWEEYHRAGGRPETVEGYGLSDWAPPDGIPWDDKTTKGMIERFHAHGLSTKQAQGILNDYADLTGRAWTEHLEGADRMNQETVSALEKEWGAAYAGKMEAAKRAGVYLSGPSGEEGNLLDQIILADGRALGDHPDVVRLFAKIGEQIAEDGGLQGLTRRTTKTPDEAKRDLDEMLGDPVKMKILTDITHPEHKALQERKTELEKQVYNV